MQGSLMESQGQATYSWPISRRTVNHHAGRIEARDDFEIEAALASEGNLHP